MREPTHEKITLTKEQERVTTDALTLAEQLESLEHIRQNSAIKLGSQEKQQGQDKWKRRPPSISTAPPVR